MNRAEVRERPTLIIAPNIPDPDGPVGPSVREMAKKAALLFAVVLISVTLAAGMEDFFARMIESKHCSAFCADRLGLFCSLAVAVGVALSIEHCIRSIMPIVPRP